MEKSPQINLILQSYDAFKNEALFGRYINIEKICPELKKLPQEFSVEKIGSSFLSNPIHSVTFGKGPIKILAWSQMHGNETTTTKAVFDLFNYVKNEVTGFDSSIFLEKFTLKIIPMLNPDGAYRYTRENVNGIDLNRDAHELKAVESRILRDCLESFHPNYCFNLHDQRSIYSAGKISNSATLSFLAPAIDEEKTINEVRKKSMQLIAAINANLQNFLPGQIGRYDDNFNPNCTGDNFQKTGIPTLLFEAGHYPGDYNREESRKYVFLALIAAFHNILSEEFTEFSTADYFQIPQNEKLFCDLLLRNVLVEEKIMEVAIQLDEKIKAGTIYFEPVVQEINEKSSLFGHQEFDCEGKPLKNQSVEFYSESFSIEDIMLKSIKKSIKNE